jgi:hypothetical protein
VVASLWAGRKVLGGRKLPVGPAPRCGKLAQSYISCTVPLKRGHLAARDEKVIIDLLIAAFGFRSGYRRGICSSRKTTQAAEDNSDAQFDRDGVIVCMVIAFCAGNAALNPYFQVLLSWVELSG